MPELKDKEEDLDEVAMKMKIIDVQDRNKKEMWNAIKRPGLQIFRKL